jgi:hypothetical protein
MKKLFSILPTAALLGSHTTGVIRAAPADPRPPVSYYIARAGSDANPGTDPRHPWQTVSNLNQLKTFGPGDRLLFRGGETFAGGLLVTLAGTRDRPCVLGSYGSGAATLTDFAPYTQAICRLLNSEHVIVTRLNFIGAPGAHYPGTNFVPVNKGQGLAITSTRQSGNRLQSVLVQHCLFKNTFQGLWVDCDRGPKVDGFDGVSVTHCTFDGVYQCGCYIIGYGILKTGPVDQSLDVRIESSQFYRIYGDPNFPSESQAVSVSGTTGIVIEHNVFGDNCGYGGYFAGSPNGGSAAFGVSNCRNVRIRRNEVYGTKCARQWDGCAIDLDQDSQNAEVCYNLTYCNDGPSIQLGSFGGATNRDIAIHHNLSYNDARGCHTNSVQGVLRVWGNADGVQFYNNTVYVDKLGSIGTPSCYSEEVGNNRHICVLNNLFKTTQGVPMVRPNGTAGGEYNPCHIGSSTRFIGNCYDASGGPLVISTDDTRGAYRTVTTMADWQALGQERLEGALCGVSEDAGLRALGSFKPPLGGFLPKQDLRTVRNFDLAAASACRGRGIDPAPFVTLRAPLKAQRPDFHGREASSFNIGAVQTPHR